MLHGVALVSSLYQFKNALFQSTIRLEGSHLRNAFVHSPSDRIREVVLHVSDSPLLVAFVQERFPVPSTSTEVHLNE